MNLGRFTPPSGVPGHAIPTPDPAISPGQEPSGNHAARLGSVRTPRPHSCPPTPVIPRYDSDRLAH